MKGQIHAPKFIAQENKMTPRKFSLNRPVLKKIWHLNIKCLKGRNSEFFMQYKRLTNVTSLSNHCCEVFISKWTSEGMHRSLAKQDTLGGQMAFHISLLWTKCLLLAYPWLIHTNLFEKTAYCNTCLRIAFPITETSNILKWEAAEYTSTAVSVLSYKVHGRWQSFRLRLLTYQHHSHVPKIHIYIAICF
jgi:hypothetical protein